MEYQSIIDNRGSISLDQQAQKVNFCELWPTVKGGLELLQNIIKNPIAKAAVGIVIAAGDAVAKSICG